MLLFICISLFYEQPMLITLIPNSGLYIGGGFWSINGDSIQFLAKWIGGSYIDSCGNMTSIMENNLDENYFNIYPNPSNGNNISVSFPYISSGDYQVLNILGEVVANGNIMNTDKIEINLGGIAQGCYFVKVQARDRSYVGRFVKGD